MVVSLELKIRLIFENQIIQTMGRYLLAETRAVREACQGDALKFLRCVEEMMLEFYWTTVSLQFSYQLLTSLAIGSFVFAQERWAFKNWWHSLRLAEDAKKQKPVSDWER